MDTITDFIDYLSAKAEYISNSQITIMEGGEEDFLAMYLTNARKFPKSDGLLFMGSGIWDDFVKSAPYKSRRKADTDSYLWDKLIETVANFALEGKLLLGPNLTETEIALRYMAKESRLNRRALSLSFFDWIAKSMNVPSRIVAGPSDIAYVFLAKEKETTREMRRMELEIRCFIARGEVPEYKTIIGLATEVPSDVKGFSLDLYCLHLDNWTGEDQEAANKAKLDLSYFSDQRRSTSSMDEFPKES